MATVAPSENPWLRPVFTPSEHRALLALREIFEHSGYVVWPNQKLSQIIHRRPDGVTAGQWSYATRAQLDFIDVTTRRIHLTSRSNLTTRPIANLRLGGETR